MRISSEFVKFLLIERDGTRKDAVSRNCRILPLASFLLSFLLLLSGCALRGAPAPAPFAAQRDAQLDAQTAESLRAGLEHCWLQRPETTRIRFDAQLEYGAKTFALSLFMELRPQAGEARVVGMTEMGLKLFDVSVTRTEATPHFFAPNVRKPEELTQIVATVTRRVFLPVFPASITGATRKKELLLLSSESKRAPEFAFDATSKTLFKAECAGDCGGWRVSYRDYQGGPVENALVPKRILYEDLKRGVNAQFALQQVRLP